MVALFNQVVAHRGLPTEPPKTWTEFTALIRELTDYLANPETK